MFCLQGHSILNMSFLRRLKNLDFRLLHWSGVGTGWWVTWLFVSGKFLEFWYLQLTLLAFYCNNWERSREVFELFLGVFPYFHLYVGEYSVALNSRCIFMFLFFPDNWWSQVCPRYFLRLVDLYKGAVVYLLSGRKTLLIPVLFSSYITAALRLLEKLHKVSLGCTLAQDAKMQILTRSCLAFANWQSELVTALACELSCVTETPQDVSGFPEFGVLEGCLVLSQILGTIHCEDCCCWASRQRALLWHKCLCYYTFCSWYVGAV